MLVEYQEYEPVSIRVTFMDKSKYRSINSTLNAGIITYSISMYNLNLDSDEHLAIYLDASLRFPCSRQILAKGYIIVS